ncbi:transcriptional regulator, PadR family [Desulfoscipio geothermicus DSM 3669]|uniref:Transcriptional regulator, PadR family n=1 Tax=Desulfoscipio geothermicus DSM 3669 TaxID=1121426 RepID=A0A1I6D2M0_9FIRM|nr:transcriptional regulator, PadR family [Desulfoscipio geothermicus DSM 3669]
MGVLILCQDHGSHHKGSCRCAGMQMGRFMQPCLLLLLHRQSTHGYELMQQLEEFGFASSEIDPGTTYRHLRKMEDERLVRSRWETEQGGPAKRLYEITAEGEEILHAWAVTINFNKQRLEKFLEQYQSQFQEPTNKKGEP